MAHPHEESCADRNQRLARLRAQRHRARQRMHRSQRLASQREREARQCKARQCKARRREQESPERRYASLPQTAATTACIIIRLFRLAAMKESDERITSIFDTLLATSVFNVCS